MQNKRLDARPDQLKLVRLEYKTLRPLAKTLLSESPTSAKRAAIACAALAIASLSGAPEAFAAKIGLGNEHTQASLSALAQASDLCNELASLVETEAEKADLYARLTALFGIVDQTHRELHTLAVEAGARLFRVGDDRGIGDGGGNTDGLVRWLTQSMTLAR